MKYWILFGLFATISLQAMAVEEPSYQILLNEAPYEHRRYSSFVVAETFVTGDFDAAGRTGFRRIANYIFGNNVDRTGESRKIAMTAPVTVEAERDGWRLHFVMPGDEKLDALPQPNRPDVKLRQIGEHDMAVVRFSGWTTEAAIQEQTAKLRAWMQRRGLPEGGEPQVARYNDPFTLPWRRRNEILIPVKR
jgi:hypothetical protein